MKSTQIYGTFIQLIIFVPQIYSYQYKYIVNICNIAIDLIFQCHQIDNLIIQCHQISIQHRQSLNYCHPMQWPLPVSNV